MKLTYDYTFKFNPTDIKEEDISDLSLTYYDDGNLKMTERVTYIHPRPKKPVPETHCKCCIL